MNEACLLQRGQRGGGGKLQRDEHLEVAHHPLRRESRTWWRYSCKGKKSKGTGKTLTGVFYFLRPNIYPPGQASRLRAHGLALLLQPHLVPLLSLPTLSLQAPHSSAEPSSLLSLLDS